MNLRVDFPGEMIRFEGDRTVMLRRLPLGAKVQRARVTVTPVAAPGRAPFEELLTFTGDVGESGMTKVAQAGFVEVDFHARRTLAAVAGPNVSGSQLLVDPGGGVFMAVAENGGLVTQDDDQNYLVPAAGVLPGLTVQKFRLQLLPPAVASPNTSQVTVRTAPTNVSLALGQLPAFWVRPGQLIQPETSDDFADILQLFLNEAEVKDGYYDIPLVIHSDALTRLNVSVAMEFTVEQSALPEGVNDVALPYSHATTANTESAMIQVALPVGAQVTDASVSVLGSFEASRVAVGPVGPVEPVAAVPILAGGQAQPILLTKMVAATAVDLLLSCTTQAAVLNLNVLADVDGKPFGDALLPKPVAIEIDRDVAATATWISAKLPQMFQFPANERVWLVVQAREGEAAWHTVAASSAVAEADRIGLQYSTTAGLSWRASKREGANAAGDSRADDGRLTGLFRLRHVPSEFQMPLSVLVGAGDAAVPVSLDRFTAQGRIDFTVDFPEFVSAINQAGQAMGTAVPQGEQLQNGDFAHWTTVGDRIGEPQPLSENIAGFSMMAIAPNGEWAFLGGGSDNATFLSLPLHRTFSSDLPIPSSRQHLAISRDSQRIYLVRGFDELSVIEAQSRERIGEAVPTSAQVECLALSLDGRYLYLGSTRFSPRHGEVAVIDTGILEGLLRHGRQFSLNDALVGQIPLEEDTRPTSMAVSPDGRRLWVAANQIGSEGSLLPGKLYMIDTASHQPPTESLEVGNEPADVALTPDGRWVLIAHSSDDTVAVVDAARLRQVNRLSLPKPAGTTLWPMAVEVSPDGRRAFVANQNNQSISVIDLATAQVADPLVIGRTDAGGMDTAVTPAGDRLYVAVDNAITPGIFFLPLGRQFPDSWMLTQGFATPFPFGEPFHLTAVLGPFTEAEREARPARPSALSQVVAATAGSSYDFSFWGIAEADGATAEIIWRGGSCSLQRIDRVPVQIAEPTKIRTSRQNITELQLHRARLQAPAGTTQAEIRFMVPTEKRAIIDSVSFQATAETVSNGDFLLVNEEGEVAGWELLPATAVGFTILPDEAGTQLSNAGGQPVALVQRFPVTTGQDFILLCQGEMVSQLAGREAARVELHWLDAQTTPMGNITSLPIQPGETEHRLQATVPTAVTQAELHLVIPPASTLSVRQLSFVPVQLVMVPVQFLAQAPGDLTVTGFRVAYDTHTASAAPTPAAGLCPPTPPGRRPDGKSGCVCSWCATPCCDACADEAAGAHDHAAPVAGPVRALAQVRRMTRPLTVSRAPLLAQAALVREPVAVVALPRPVLPVVEPVVAVVPLTAIQGIGERRAAVLTELGIDSIARLATAVPEFIDAALPGVSLRMAQEFVAEARELARQ
jgi:YVTN family beta-propeller protein